MGVANLASLANAGSQKLGVAVVDVVGDLTKLHTGFGAAQNATTDFTKKVDVDMRKVGQAFTIAGAAITGSLVAAATHTVRYGDELDKMSKRTGIAVETLSALSYAAQISGTNVQSVEQSMRFLARAMDDTAQGTGEAKEKFENFGISVVDTQGNLRSTVDVFLEAADKIANMTSETEAVAAATDLFGARFGTQLLPLLKEGRGGIIDLMNAAEGLGLVISTETASAAAELNDRITDLKSSFSAVVLQIGEALLPLLQPLVERLTRLVTSAGEWVDANEELTGQLVAVAAALGGMMVAGGPLLMMAPSIATITAGIMGSGGLVAALGSATLAVAPLVSAMWAFHKVVNAIFTPLDEHKVALDALSKANKTYYSAIKEIEDAVCNAREVGLDPYNMTMMELANVTDETQFNLVALSNALNDNQLYGRDVSQVMNVLHGMIEKNAEKGKALKEQIEQVSSAEGIVKTATEEVTGAFGDLGRTVETTGNKAEETGQKMAKSALYTLESVAAVNDLIDAEEADRQQKQEERGQAVADAKAKLNALLLRMDLEHIGSVNAASDQAFAESQDRRAKEHDDSLEAETEFNRMMLDADLAAIGELNRADDEAEAARQAKQAEAYDAQMQGETGFQNLLNQIESENQERRVEVAAMGWRDYLAVTNAGIGNIADSYILLREIVGNTEMSMDEIRSSWLVKLANWVDKVCQLINSVSSAWNNILTIIANVSAMFGGGGGGDQLAQIMGYGGDGGGLGGLANLAGAGGGTGALGALGKIGGGIKAGAGAVAGLPWGALGGAAITGAGLGGAAGILGWTAWNMYQSMTQAKGYYGPGSGYTAAEQAEIMKNYTEIAPGVWVRKDAAAGSVAPGAGQLGAWYSAGAYAEPGSSTRDYTSPYLGDISGLLRPSTTDWDAVARQNRELQNALNKLNLTLDDFYRLQAASMLGTQYGVEINVGNLIGSVYDQESLAEQIAGILARAGYNITRI